MSQRFTRLFCVLAAATATTLLGASSALAEPPHPGAAAQADTVLLDTRDLEPPPAKKGMVALTFDDLPGLSLFNYQPYTDWFNLVLVDGLKRHHLPAIGFVNEGKLDEMVRSRQIANLERWLDAGFELGNHTFSHETPNDLGAARYIADIARGEPVTRGLLEARGRTIRYFRHPYLETGFPMAAKREIDHWLAEHGYTIAPVTIDANDWEFSEPYDDAVRRVDNARMARIRHQYLAYTEQTVAWFQHASHDLFDRQVAFVFLLHDTRLNADCIDELAAILKRRNLKAVTLDKVMRDPAYRLPDNYRGKDGVDWFERWAEDLHKSLPWHLWHDAPADIAAEYKIADAEAK